MSQTFITYHGPGVHLFALMPAAPWRVGCQSSSFPPVSSPYGNFARATATGSSSTASAAVLITGVHRWRVEVAREDFRLAAEDERSVVIVRELDHPLVARPMRNDSFVSVPVAVILNRHYPHPIPRPRLCGEAVEGGARTALGF